MQIIASAKELQSTLLKLKQSGKALAFVPTMGNLHEGHLSLVRKAKQAADIVIASIFVNPMQFGPNEDFDSYPRTEADDQKKLIAEGCDYLFLPQVSEIYPEGKENHTAVEVPDFLTNKLCGASRPGHFRGVTTIVNKLFNIVQPDVAVFGKKDYQQFTIIKKMVSDLLMPIEIIGVETYREDNGLAMSSRNGYLTAEEKSSAEKLYQQLKLTAEKYKNAPENLESIRQQAIDALAAQGFTIDYFEIVNRNDFSTATNDDKEVLIAAAAYFGKPRLIDNIEVDL